MSFTFDEPFDPTEEEGTPALTVLPMGRYRAEVIDGSIADTKNGRGTMLHLTWSILDGQFEKRMVWQSIIFRHESADAQRIGRYQIKDLCDACGIVDPVTDVSVFNFKPCLITVGVQKDKDGVYNDKNKVTRIMRDTPPMSGINDPPVPPQPRPSIPLKNELNDDVPF